MPPTGFDNGPVYRLKRAIRRILKHMYLDRPLPESPISYSTPNKTERNREIVRRYEMGETLEDLAAMYAISIARVHEIVTSYQKH